VKLKKFQMILCKHTSCCWYWGILVCDVV